MLEMKPVCERCGKPLPANSREGRICSYECTFCEYCSQNVLEAVCPNCGGELQPRPARTEK